MLKKKFLLKMLIIITASLSLVACEGGIKEKTQTSKIVIEDKTSIISQSLELYNGMNIKQILLLQEADKVKLEIEFGSENIKELKEYSLKIQARPLKELEQKELTNGVQYWDISLNNIFQKNNKYYIIKEINPLYKEYILNIALYKVERLENGEIKHPNFGKQNYVNLKI